jgi:hypothetical protein
MTFTSPVLAARRTGPGERGRTDSLERSAAPQAADYNPCSVGTLRRCWTMFKSADVSCDTGD